MKAGLARVLRWLTWVNLLATAVVIAAVLAYGRDWPRGLRGVWEALTGGG